jgi:hypothetical protein
MRISVWCVVVLAIGCGKKHDREAYPVGSFIGGGSVLFGSSHCKYDAPPSVIELTASGEMGTLVGEGTVKVSCPSGVDYTVDVLKVTGARIDGPDTIKIHDDLNFYYPKLLAGTRELATWQIPRRPEWIFGKDCAGVASEIPDNSSQDFGGRSGNLQVAANGKGSCTITGVFHGQTATKTFKVE